MNKIIHPNSQTRLSMYQTVLYILKRPHYFLYRAGICEMLFTIYKLHYDLTANSKLDVNYIINLFPELKEYDPNPTTSEYWWPVTEQGRYKRIEVITEIIQKLSK